MTLTAWEAAARLFEKPQPKWRTPGEMAVALDPRTRQTPALDLIDRKLVEAFNTPDSRLIISMPPQAGKSQRVSRRFPTWVLTQRPETRVTIASYETGVARRWGRAIRDDIVTHGTELGLAVRPDLSAQSEWQLAGHDGGVFTAGIGSALTGRPSDLMLIDDPVKNSEEAESAVYRERAWDWYRETAMTRLAPGAPVIIIMCMTGDTPVLMADGSERRLSTIRPGDEVATYEDGRLATSTVLNWANQGPDDLFRIRMKSGRSVRANARHPFLTIDENGTKTWTRTDQIRPGARILRATGESGEASPVPSTDATSQLSARACATRTTTKNAGHQDTEHHPLTQQRDGEPASSTVTGSPIKKSMSSSMSRTAYAPSASSHRATRTPAPTGTANSASITTTSPEKSGGSSATTATSLSATARHQKYSEQPLTTWSVTADEVLSVEPCGSEDVFDLQIDRTENFIANGLVSHNTRWHHDDLAGRVIADDPTGVRVLNIPAQADHSPERGETDPLGREPGEYMVTTRGMTAAQWEVRKKRSGPRTWNALYQGRPTAKTGGIFPNAWPRYEAPLWEARPDGTRVVPSVGRDDVELIQSWDLAFKDSTGSDFVVGQVWLRNGPDAYLLDMIRARMSFTATLDAVRSLSARWPQALAKLVEDKANGPAVINTLRRELPGLVPVDPEGSKVARANSVSYLAHAANVHLPTAELLPNVEELVEEARGFPAGKHDDAVDAMTQALNQLYHHPLGESGVVVPDVYDDLGWSISPY